MDFFQRRWLAGEERETCLGEEAWGLGAKKRKKRDKTALGNLSEDDTAWVQISTATVNWIVEGRMNLSPVLRTCWAAAGNFDFADSEL